MLRDNLLHRSFAAIVTVFAVTAPFPILAETSPTADQALVEAIHGANRTPDFKLRDKYRHPLETLEFFGIKPDMTVIEVLPGAGWYTEILAPYLKAHGRLIEATPPTTSSNEYQRKQTLKYLEKLKSDPSDYAKVEMAPFEPPTPAPLGQANTADMVVTFLNIHDLVYVNAHHEMTSYFLESFFKSAFAALKPGGVLGVVEHRAPKGSDVVASLANLRLPQDYVVSVARAAGFKAVEISEVDANTEDKGTEPVWYFPPMLKSPPGTQIKYKSVGESDGMTLRFIKSLD